MRHSLNLAPNPAWPSMLGRARALVICVVLRASAFVIRRPARAPMAAFSSSATDLTRPTIKDYDDVAEDFWEGTKDHDVSQNVDALLLHLGEGRHRILDFGCGPGRDVATFARLGHDVVGLDGSAKFCAMARALTPAATVLQQDFVELDLAAAAPFDGVFANAALFHVPSGSLPRTLAALRGALREGGVLFASNPHGFGEDKEGWTQGRVEGGARYVCWQSEGTWCATMQTAGFVELDRYYRPAGQPRERQPWFATVWRKGP